jgi:hypothetical protein
MSDIAALKTRLAALQPYITGVLKAYPQAPKNIPDTDVPLMLNFVGPATYDDDGGENVIEMREIKVRLYVCRKQEGIDGEAEARVEPFIPLVWAFFAARPGLGSGGTAITPRLTPLAGVLRVQVISDSGVTVLPYNQIEYLGVEFRLIVTMIIGRTYAPYE